MSAPALIDPDVWMTRLFAAQAVNRGGVVRRKIRDVDMIVGRERFLSEVSRRGFRVVENSGQFIVICNQDPIRILV